MRNKQRKFLLLGFDQYYCNLTLDGIAIAIMVTSYKRWAREKKKVADVAIIVGVQTASTVL